MWVEIGGGAVTGDDAAAGEGETGRFGDGLGVGAASGLGLVAGELEIEAAADGDCPAVGLWRESGVATMAAARTTRTSAASAATITWLRLFQRVKKTRTMPAGQHKTSPASATHVGTAGDVGTVAGGLSGGFIERLDPGATNTPVQPA